MSLKEGEQTVAKVEPLSGAAGPGADGGVVTWVMAATGWSLAGLLFFLPACYWVLIHGLAVVGFFSIATGRARTMWPSFENAVTSMQRVAAAAVAVSSASSDILQPNPAQKAPP